MLPSFSGRLLFSHLHTQGGQRIRKIFTLDDHMVRDLQIDRGKIPNGGDTAGNQRIADLLFERICELGD